MTRREIALAVAATAIGLPILIASDTTSEPTPAAPLVDAAALKAEADEALRIGRSHWRITKTTADDEGLVTVYTRAYPKEETEGLYTGICTMIATTSARRAKIAWAGGDLIPRTCPDNE